jgi:hypothetical protein
LNFNSIAIANLINGMEVGVTVRNLLPNIVHCWALPHIRWEFNRASQTSCQQTNHHHLTILDLSLVHGLLTSVHLIFIFNLVISDS